MFTLRLVQEKERSEVKGVHLLLPKLDLIESPREIESGRD